MKKVRKRFKRVEEDCANFTATELREKYSSEYRAWSNHKYKQKQKGVPVHPDYELFKSFLKDIGPKPFASASLDRIDNDDPEYAPGKVRWADKKTQTRNRSNTVKIIHEGREYTAAYISETHNLPIATVRERIRKGWSFHEVINGKSKGRGGTNDRSRADDRRRLSPEQRLWPWLGPKMAVKMEEKYQWEMPNYSRFDYYREQGEMDLEYWQRRFDDAQFIVRVKQEGRFHDPDVQQKLDYRDIETPLSSITERTIDELLHEKDLITSAIKKHQHFKYRNGPFHRVPDWDDYDDLGGDWRD